jgi:SAM-dependent methyltransferase
MSWRKGKTPTDVHWNERARNHEDQQKVNIDDLVQRSLENDFIFSQLSPENRVLEVGCGNGHLTQELRNHVGFVDSFDFSENMISMAKENIGEKNNRFFVHSVLSSDSLDGLYDAVVCVRVLINLANTDEQIESIRNMASWLKPGGKLILIEGYSDGFVELNSLRRKCDLEELKPAAINFYAFLKDIKSVLSENFEILDTWHSGMYDILTRITYPLLIGADKATSPSDFHSKILPLAKHLNPKEFENYARLVGYSLLKK